jgi:hypothetical protein
MSVTHIVGVDPGLVHTGVVGLAFNPHTKSVLVKHEAVAGPDADAVRRWSNKHMYLPHEVFIEKYQPRSNLNSDARMTEAVVKMRQAFLPETKAQVLLNTGVKKVVKQPLMELLGCWKFSTTTHHQDLRSAARIAIYGMLKDERYNRLIADIVLARLNGEAWDVVTS